MALIKCPECGKKVSDMAKACPKCGMPLDNLNTTDIDKEVVSGNSTVIKKVQSKKILIIIAACLLALIAVFLIYLYGGSQYKLKDTVITELELDYADIETINRSYGELDRRCKIAQLINLTLSEDVSENMSYTSNYLLTYYDSTHDLDKSLHLSYLSDPFSFYDEFVEKYYNESDIKNYHNKKTNDEYRAKIQEALRKVKEDYCE
ncbi:MAG: zinc-ribbon domain-containing protein [Oscillospiraceae bacterium]|nr:zinc-ribbon domain-containing protein [Oscillospiraceae bacterium]